MTPHRPTASKGRAAVYCRTSTDNQDTGLSTSTQADNGCRRSESRGFLTEDQDIFIDEAISGMTDQRAAFQEMMFKVFSPERPYEAVIVDDISRLSRETVGYIDYEKMFAKAGIELISLMDPAGNPEVKINTTRRMKAVMNEGRLADDALKTRNSQNFAVEMGFFIGWVPPFGYRKIKVLWKSAEHTKLEPDPETWPHLLHIIDMAKNNYTISDIRSYLTQTGLIHPAGVIDSMRRLGKLGRGEWTNHNTSYLLKNVALLGWTARGGEGSGSEFLHKSEHFICYDAHQAAMTWEERELILSNFTSRRSTHKSPKVHKSPNIMADRVFCGICDAPMQMHTETRNGTKVQRLACANKRRLKKNEPTWCPNPSVRLDILVGRTLAALLGNILTPLVLQQQVSMVAKENSNFVANRELRKKEIDKRTKELAKQIDNIVDATADGKRNPAYDQGIERRQKEITVLQREKETIDADLHGKLAFVNDPDRIVQNALDLRTYLETDDQHSLRQALTSLIRRASIVNRVATLEYVVPLPRNKTDQATLRDRVPLGKALVHP